MTSYRELREISLDFRRISSNLLTATFENADVRLERFKNYIDSVQFIKEKIQSTIRDVDFEFSQCFVSKHGGDWHGIRVPTDEACHVKAMYDYITFILSDERNLFCFARDYSRKSKFDEIIEDFVDTAFKPLIDFINDSISKEMILLEEERRTAAVPITQNFGSFYGTFNQQGTGSITSYNTTNASTTEITELISKILSSLDHIQGVSQDDIEDVKDDLDSITEQIVSTAPKKNRLQKALSGIKKFVSNCGMKLAVNWATGKITEMDWAEAIEKIEQFVSTLG